MVSNSLTKFAQTAAARPHRAASTEHDHGMINGGAGNDRCTIAGKPGGFNCESESSCQRDHPAPDGHARPSADGV